MKHILTVDDEAPIRDILCQALTGTGYRVSGAESVREAIDIIQQDRPDLIISDLQLEESDGFEFIEQIKQIAPGLPIILLTGALLDPAVVRRLATEKIAYVEKTARLERILSEVKRLLAA